MLPQDDEYDYGSSGFDPFLNRSVDNLYQSNLDSQGPLSTQMRYDSAQVSGMIGDTLQIGQVSINRESITVSDGENTRLLIGRDPGGF